MANIAYRAELARTEFLSDPDKRLQWQSHSLPTDDLCTENAIMLSRLIFVHFYLRYHAQQVNLCSFFYLNPVFIKFSNID